MKKQNECLNFFKGIACILVVSLHVRFPVEAVDGVIQCIARFAVPLFFMISGYYCCFEDDGIYLKKLPGKIKHIVKICLLSMGFWIVMQYAVCFLGAGEHDATALTASILSINSLVRLVLLNDDPVISILWFLFALLYCYLIYYLAARIKCLKVLPKLVVPALILHFVIGNVGTGLLNWSIDVEYYRNVWLMGLPLFTIGHGIKKKQDVILKKVEAREALLLLLSGVVLSLIEWSIVGGRQQMYVGSIVMAASCIIYSVWNVNRRVIAPVAYIGRFLSMYVYVLHISVGIILDRVAKMIHVNEMFSYQCMKPTLVILSTIVISVLISSVMRKMGS